MTAIFTQNDHFFKPDQIDRKRLICSAFNQNGQVWKKWSFWVKIVVIAMQCNAMQCNFNEGDMLGADKPLPINVNLLSPIHEYFLAKIGFLLKKAS